MKAKQISEKNSVFEINSGSVPKRKFVPVYIDFLNTSLLSAKEKLVFIALKSFIDFGSDEGSVYPSIEKIAQLTSLSPSTVARAIKGLQDKGILKKRRRGLTKTNIYTLSDMASMWETKTTAELVKMSERKIDVSTEELLEELERRGYTIKKEPVSAAPKTSDTSISNSQNSADVCAPLDQAQYKAEEKQSQYDMDTLKVRFGYENIISTGEFEKELVDVFFQRMFEMITSSKTSMYVSGGVKSTQIVREKLLELTEDDIVWALGKYMSQVSKKTICNVHAYVGSLLFGAHEQHIQEETIKNITSSIPKKEKSSIDSYNNFEQRKYDYKKLEKLLAESSNN